MLEASKMAPSFRNIEYVQAQQKRKIEIPVPLFISDNSTPPSEVSSSSASEPFIQPADLS
jgi:hypothetical protein